MDTYMFDFTSMQMGNEFRYYQPVLNPLAMPLYPQPLDDMDLLDINTLHPQPINMQMMDSPIMPVTDIFGYTRFCDPMSVDIMSGLPTNTFPQATAHAMYEQNQSMLEEHCALEHERDLAVEKQNDAMRNKDYEEALKWENIANSRQQDIYNLWGTPNYGLPAKAPGLI